MASKNAYQMTSRNHEKFKLKNGVKSGKTKQLDPATMSMSEFSMILNLNMEIQSISLKQ